MPWLSLMPILIWALICGPLLILFWLINPTNRLMLILVWVAYTLVNLVFFMTVNWALLNYYLRFAPIAFSLAIFIRWQKPFRNTPWLPNPSLAEIGGIAAILVVMVFPIYMLVGVYRSSNVNNFTDIPLLSLYPVRTGLYVIANAGDNLEGWGMNTYGRSWFGQPTGRDEEMLFAVDIFEMRTNGMIADSVLESDHRKYEIFNEAVYSPCFGEVVFVDDGRPDIAPYSTASGPQDRLGNRLTIQCDDEGFLVTLSNLRRIGVEVGERVSFIQIIGRVGNSASGSVPSLHMHVTTPDGLPVPILFEAGYYFRFVARNHVFVRSP
jgi:hypothetical protein